MDEKPRKWHMKDNQHTHDFPFMQNNIKIDTGNKHSPVSTEMFPGSKHNHSSTVDDNGLWYQISLYHRFYVGYDPFLSQNSTFSLQTWRLPFEKEWENY